ncbi:MAG TPA: response regulator [Spirochaetota bacterium]|nr:response regulator [Spirochaetota bacterium]HPI91285.1 response regulator [Spirochaetota bacterium]HPR50037.1 response regulator [Spirochaetota bacterium]
MDLKKDKHPTILIVEDDYSSSVMLKGLLESSGYRVADIVVSGEEAMERAKSLMPDLILMDITLKGKLDGINAYSEIKKSRDIPVIYLTVSTDDDVIQRAKKTMPHGYILKPYNKHILHSTLEMAFYKIEMEKKLHESERRNREILDTIPDRVFRIRADGSFVDDNDARTGRKVWSDKVARRALSAMGRLHENGEARVFDYTLKRENHIDHYEARMVPSSEGQTLVIVRDVTERKISEVELEKYRNNLEEIVNKRTSELSDLNREMQQEIDVRRTIEQNLRIFSHAITQSPEVVAIINNDGLIEYVNSKFTELYGRSFNEIVGKKVTDPGNCLIPEPELWDTIRSRDSWRGELYNMNARKELVYLNAKISSIRDEENRASHYILIGDDITENKKEKEALSRIQESLQRKRDETEEIELDWQEWKEKIMSRNISRTDKSLFRNINNSFTQGAGFGTLITLFDMMHTSAEHRNDRYLVDSSLYEMIVKNVHIAQEAFKTFSNIDWIISNEFELSKISFLDLHQIIKAVITKANEFIGIKKQKIVLSEYSPVFSPFMVNINKEYFFTALFELLLNAMKFSKNQTMIAVLLYVMNGAVSVSVINEPEKSDEGVLGIPMEYEKVVFEPFYRMTKFVYEQYNTLDFGLGLTLVEKIVSRHGAEVIAENILDHTDLKREPQVKVSVTLSFPMPFD